MITDIVDNTVDMCISDDQDTAEWNLQELNVTSDPDHSAAAYD